MYSRQVIKHTNNKSFKEKNSESRVATRDYLKCPVFNNIVMSMQRIKKYPYSEEKAVNRNCLWDNPDVGFIRQRPENGYYTYVQKMKGNYNI